MNLSGNAPAQAEVRFPTIAPDAPKPLGAIQQRKYALKNEFNVGLTWLPADPYVEGIAVSAGYTQHFNDHIGWEIAALNYAFNFDTTLRRNVIQFVRIGNGDVSQIFFPEVEWVASSRFVLKPLYGKQSFANQKNYRMEVEVRAGPALVGMASLPGIGNTVTRSTHIGGDIQFGARWWGHRHWSTRFMVGATMFRGPRSGGGDNELRVSPYLNAVLSFSQPRRRR